jgi:hypothetical protein
MTIPKFITLDRILSFAIIIALLITLKTCGNQRDASLAREAKQESLLQEATAARKQEATRAWEYKNDLQVAQYEARKADTAAQLAKASAQSKSAEIRQLYALLREPWPKDTATRLVISERCCDSAVSLANDLESLWMVDSLKDQAYMKQIDLATARVDTLQQALTASEQRFGLATTLFHAPPKPRGSGWIGSEAAFGKTAQAGVYFKWQTPAGKEYKVGTGLQPNGPYISLGAGFKISFRKKR